MQFLFILSYHTVDYSTIKCVLAPPARLSTRTPTPDPRYAIHCISVSVFHCGWKTPRKLWNHPLSYPLSVPQESEGKLGLFFFFLPGVFITFSLFFIAFFNITPSGIRPAGLPYLQKLLQTGRLQATVQVVLCRFLPDQQRNTVCTVQLQCTVLQQNCLDT